MTGVKITMDTKLSTWLNYECKARGWSHRELGRRAGVTGQMVSGVIAGDRNPGWDFCAGVAKALGKPPLELFRLAGLLPEESHGENEPALLHHYRELSPPNQRAALAMLRGLAGQQGPVAQPPAEGADVDAVCKMLARLDSDRLEMAAIFIRWLIEQPGGEQGAGRPRAAGTRGVGCQNQTLTLSWRRSTGPRWRLRRRLPG